MKLRLRSLHSKETLRIEVPSQSSLQQLKDSLSIAVSSSLSVSASIRFSLNRKDELSAPSPDDSLQSLGITSGDLIYYSLNPDDFAEPQTLIPDTASSSSVQVEQGRPSQEIVNQDLCGKELPCFKAESDMTGPNQDTGIEEQGKMEDVQEFVNQESMDIDENKKFSEPYFLRRVLRKELADDGSHHKLLVIAVHAVLLESGFVGVDSVSGMQSDRFHLQDEWPSKSFTATLWYTLPELLAGGITESIILKFQSLGHFINVYGSLSSGGSGLHRVCLNKNKFGPTIDLVWANCDQTVRMYEDGGSSSSYPDSEVFEFWKIVKDGIALPLLIDLCDKSGLALPACLMRLPTELKLKILELLPGVDVAKMGCVCSETRYISSNNDLWKQKFEEEFGSGELAPGMVTWKQKFASAWEEKKKRNTEIIPGRQLDHGLPFFYDPFFLRMIGVAGGDYDRMPELGFPPLHGQPGRGYRRPRTRGTFATPCNLGGFMGQ